MAPDITHIPAFADDSDSLFDMILHAAEFDRSMKARWTASFGKPYDYNGMTYPAIPFTDMLADLADRVAAIVGFVPNNCLVNLYHDGRSSMGYHSDNTDILSPGTGVAIVSLGSDRTLRFKSKSDPDAIADYSLTDGSLFYMDAAVQDHWLHSIPKSDSMSPRISLTFRSIL